MTIGKYEGDEFADENLVKARAVLGIMSGASLQPQFGFDPLSAEGMWAEALAAFDAEIVRDAAIAWITDKGNMAYPTLAQFVDVVLTCQRKRSISPSYRSEHLDGPCPECGDGDPENPTDGFVVHFREDGTVANVVPCSRCKPEQRSLWLAGHYKPRRTPKCTCGHDLCSDSRSLEKARS